MSYQQTIAMTVLAALTLCTTGYTADKNPNRPNILFIFTDDHATAAISAYGSKINKTPNLDRLAGQGMRFDRCLVTNSICAPSRAVILTGKYSHINGQLTNRNRFDGSQQTAPKLLTAAGYQTAIVGKWHLKSTPTGFEHFEVLKGQGQYYNPLLLTNGKTIKHTGYTTDIITDRALKWLDSRDKTKPFFLMAQHKAPHGRWEPALRHLNLFTDRDIPEPDTLFDDYKGRSAAARGHKMGIADHMGDARLMFKYSSKFTPQQLKVFDGFYKPRNDAFRQANLTGKQRTRWNYQRYIKNYLRCVTAVDQNIGRMLDYLDKNKLTDNTVVIYNSDQGFYLGEHGWFDKRWIYEESLRAPMIIRWPGTVKPATTNSDIVSNVDLAQTFLDIAGIKAPDDMQGASIVPILKGTTPDHWRKTFYYHYYESGGHGVPAHYGVTDKRYKLVHFYEPQLNAWEVFDLAKDPQEMTSVYDDPKYADVVKQLKAELTRLQKQYHVPMN